MHIVFFADQHAESLGGAQVSMRLQRTYLERAGHTVTIVAPRMHSARGRGAAGDPGYIDLPSIPITADREYSLTWPRRRTDRFLDRAMTRRPPVDLVHVQADFWGAFIGHRFAHRHGIPAVHTMHNRVDVGIAAVTPLHRPVLGALNLWRRTALRGIGPQPRGADGWAYLAGVAAVIDKDYASALLATEISADLFVISTAVEKVALHYGQPNQQWLDHLSLAEARQYLAEGHFAPGSMKPKIEAVIRFLEMGGKQALITSPEQIKRALDGQTGTWITSA